MQDKILKIFRFKGFFTCFIRNMNRKKTLLENGWAFMPSHRNLVKICFGVKTAESGKPKSTANRQELSLSIKHLCAIVLRGSGKESLFCFSSHKPYEAKNFNLNSNLTHHWSRLRSSLFSWFRWGTESLQWLENKEFKNMDSRTARK